MSSKILKRKRPWSLELVHMEFITWVSLDVCSGFGVVFFLKEKRKKNGDNLDSGAEFGLHTFREPMILI